MKYAWRSTLLLRVRSKSWVHSAVELPRKLLTELPPRTVCFIWRKKFLTKYTPKNGYECEPDVVHALQSDCTFNILYMQTIRQPLKRHSLMTPPNRREIICPVGAFMNSPVTVAMSNYARFESFSFSSTRRTNIGSEYLQLFPDCITVILAEWKRESWSLATQMWSR